MGALAGLLALAVVLPVALFIVGSRTARPLERRTAPPKGWSRGDGWPTSEFGLAAGEYLRVEAAVNAGERLDDERLRAAAYALADRRLATQERLLVRVPRTAVVVVRVVLMGVLLVTAVRHPSFPQAGVTLADAAYVVIRFRSWQRRRSGPRRAET